MLEKLKDYILEKQSHFDYLYDKYSSELEKHKQGTDGSKAQLNELEDQIGQIYSGESRIFQELRAQFEQEFSQVMDKAEQRVQQIKQTSEQSLREKNDELEQMKTQLSSQNFEGKQELESSISQLQQENLRLAIDIQNLELRNDLKSHSVGVIVATVKNQLEEKTILD